MISPAPCCPVCLVKNRPCVRLAGRNCNGCGSNTPSTSSLGERSFDLAEPLDRESIRYQLFKRAKPGSLMSLDSQEESDSNSLRLYIAASTGRNLDFTINFTGQFATHNDELRIALDDGICSGFSTDFEDVETTFTLIPAAVIAGGYIALLCSITDINEKTCTCLDGVIVPNEYQHSNVGKHVRYFLATRLRELVDHVMIAARVEVTYETQQYCATAYTASAILYHELSYFRHALKHGHLRDQVSGSLKKLLVDWFKSLEGELHQHLKRGCGKYPDWTSTFTGSLNSLRRNEETYTLHISFQQNKTSPQTPLDTSNVVTEPSEQAPYFVQSQPLYYDPVSLRVGPRSELDPRYRSSHYSHFQ